MILQTTVRKDIAYPIHATTFTHNAESTTYSVAFAFDFNLYIYTCNTLKNNTVKTSNECDHM